jgi:AraC-like DNA-binding protein
VYSHPSIPTADARIDRIRRYIREHLDERLDRRRLAALAGFSVSHFHWLDCITATRMLRERDSLP